MKPKDFSMREAISFGWEEMKKNFMFFLIFLVLVFATQVILEWFFKRPNFDLISQTGMVLGLIVSMLVCLAITKISLDAVNNKPLSFKNIQAVLPRFIDYFLVEIMIYVIISVGFTLLVIPGIIWSAQFSMAPYLVLDKKLNPIAALKESSRITKGNRWRLFLFNLLIILINIAGILVFIVGIFSTLPATMIAYASVYNQMKE